MASWGLWRQDDHGNEFRVWSFDGLDAAQQVRDELITRGHHQHYWVVPVGGNDAPSGHGAN